MIKGWKANRVARAIALPTGAAALLAGFVFVATNNTADARPKYANETGTQCGFCHVGTMTSKKFTQNGRDYLKYLRNNNLLPKACTMQTINLYDRQGKFVRKYTHCVP